MALYGIRNVLLTQQRNDYSEHLSEAPFELDCSMGSNPYGFCPDVKFGPELLEGIVEYPHSDDGIKDAIIEYFKGEAALGRENIVLTCGSIGAILTLNRMVLQPGKLVLGIAPQFSAVVDDFVTYETVYSPVYLRRERNYAFDLDEFLAAVRANPARTSTSTTPTTPTGQVIPLAGQEAIVAAAREGRQLRRPRRGLRRLYARRRERGAAHRQVRQPRRHAHLLQGHGRGRRPPGLHPRRQRGGRRGRQGQRPLLQERAGRAHRRVAHPLRLGWQVPRPRRRRTSRVCSPRSKSSSTPRPA